MSEAWVLSLVERYAHPRALARRARGGALFATLRRLESQGLVRLHDDRYRLTRRGRNELAMTRAVIRIVLRAA